MKRRDFLLGMSLLPSLAMIPAVGKKKIIIAGGHPDDPETGAGGVAALWASQGHEVLLVYLTTGEAGIDGTAAEKAAAIRKVEAQKANEILGTKPFFLGQIDGDSFVNNDWNKKIADFLKQQNADLILTHWPVDTHRDHRNCSMLFYDAWLFTGRREAFYYYEVMTGGQTQNFHPTNYVDISSVHKKKHEACFIHRSQKIEENYANDHGRMEVFRGMEGGYDFAEAFVKHSQSKTCDLFER
jgi:LmbE family N-acetylglucosaminyl deacetylase